MDSISKIRSGLIRAFNDNINITTPFTTIYENRRINLGTAKLWVSLHFLPGETTQATLGRGGEDVATGIFQVNISTILDNSTSDLTLLADELRRYFVGGRVITYNGQKITITGCKEAGISLSNSQTNKPSKQATLPVSITYRSYLTREDYTL